MSSADALRRARDAFARGDDAAVLREFDSVPAAQPPTLELLALGVNAALRAGELERACGWLEQLQAAQPQQAQFTRLLSSTHNNLGSRRWAAGDLSGASAGFAQALSVWPDNPEALFNRARLAIHARQQARALVDLDRLLTLRPQDRATALLRAETRIALGADDPQAELLAAVGPEGLRAIDPLRMALALADGGASDAAVALALQRSAPTELLGIADVAYRLAENSAAAAAREVYAHVATLAGRRAPALYAQIAAQLSLPQVSADAAAMAGAREAFSAGLDALEQAFSAATLRATDPLLEQLAWSNQLLAYQGHDDRALVTRYAGLLERGAQAFAPELRERPRGSGRAQRRIGFVSGAFRNSTIGAYFARWIESTTRAGHETVVVQLPPAWDATTERIGASASRLLRPQGSLRELAQQIRAQSLDLLIYPDLGVDGRISVLAALRLAPRQVMAWGHPSTFGLSTIDAMFSCAAMEPAQAQTHYTEHLLTLPGIGTDYLRPAPSPPIAREALGLPTGRCYLVPQSPSKVHPDIDAVLAAIAASDVDGMIVLFRGDRPGTTRLLRDRLAQALRAAGADPQRQLCFLPMTDRPRFLAICGASSVMVDTPHWSGGNTSIDALLSGLPVVALQGTLMRGRQSAAMLERLGIPELVCSEPAAQLKQALAVACDDDYRRSLRARIGCGLDTMLDGRDALCALQTHLETLLATPADE